MINCSQLLDQWTAGQFVEVAQTLKSASAFEVATFSHYMLKFAGTAEFKALLAFLSD